MLIFKNKPDTSTPINATNLNANFNELDANVGDLNNLDTSNKASLVDAINDLKDNIDELKLPDDWSTISNNYGTLYYKIVGDLCYLIGSCTNLTEARIFTLPFVAKRQQIFLCGGNGLYYTKAYTTPNTSNLTFYPGSSGSSATTYNICCVVHMS